MCECEKGSGHVLSPLSLFGLLCITDVMCTVSLLEELGQEGKPVLLKASPNIQTSLAAHSKLFLPNSIFTSISKDPLLFISKGCKA